MPRHASTKIDNPELLDPILVIQFGAVHTSIVQWHVDTSFTIDKPDRMLGLMGDDRCGNDITLLTSFPVIVVLDQVHVMRATALATKCYTCGKHVILEF